MNSVAVKLIGTKTGPQAATTSELMDVIKEQFDVPFGECVVYKRFKKEIIDILNNTTYSESFRWMYHWHKSPNMINKFSRKLKKKIKDLVSIFTREFNKDWEGYAMDDSKGENEEKLLEMLLGYVDVKTREIKKKESRSALPQT